MVALSRLEIWLVLFCAKLLQSCLTLCDTLDWILPVSSVHGILQATGEGCHSLFQGIFPNTGIKPRSPALQAESLPAELSGKPLV